MMKPIALFIIDGMRPDGLTRAYTPVLDKLMQDGTYTLTARTVMPSMTLPCHMSLFHSVLPERHGVTTNTYTPQVRPINGLFEVLSAAGLKTAAFYGWDGLRDTARPGSLHTVFATKDHQDPNGEGDKQLSELAAYWLTKNSVDFAFLHLEFVDVVGHAYGWMSEQYLRAISNADKCIGRVLKVLPEDTTVFVSSDHGGHAQTHGTDSPEDMTIPLIIRHDGLRGRLKESINITDVAPTIAKLLELKTPKEWIGQPIM
jgi:predicted AlkP superfamily pyrophosphatase or phosphodiesterase